MDRRSFLTKGAVGGAAAAATGTLAAPAYAQGKRTLTMVTTWGRGLAGVHDAAQRSADTITAMTDGQLTVDLKAAGELVGAFEVFDAVTAGQADLYHGADYYFINQHPAYAYFTSVPFGMTAQELANWYYHDGGHELHDELGQIFGLKSFLGGNTGAQSGGWFSKEITGPEDFQGLKFRMPGLGGETLGNMGASVQNIPGAEVYQALASGALDGTEWIGPWADEKAGFQEITKFYYTAGMHEPGAGLSLAFNRDVEPGPVPDEQRRGAAAPAVGWRQGAGIPRQRLGRHGRRRQGNAGPVCGRRHLRPRPRQLQRVHGGLVGLDHRVRGHLPGPARPRHGLSRTWLAGRGARPDPTGPLRGARLRLSDQARPRH
jgi:TRAP-type mannitol/chloroaromatic compound transport system substrate-binding protein